MTSDKWLSGRELIFEVDEHLLWKNNIPWRPKTATLDFKRVFLISRKHELFVLDQLTPAVTVFAGQKTKKLLLNDPDFKPYSSPYKAPQSPMEWLKSFSRTVLFEKSDNLWLWAFEQTDGMTTKILWLEETRFGHFLKKDTVETRAWLGRNLILGGEDNGSAVALNVSSLEIEIIGADYDPDNI